jgi:tetratricopeptide (TPR) repeat protein
MAEDKHIEGEQLQKRLEKLVDQWSQGRVSLKQIVGLSEEELFAFASQGYFMFLQGKTEPARVIFEGLVAIDPRNAYYYRALGAIYWRLKEGQKALKQFTYAIRVAPREISSYVNRAEIYVAQKQFQAARADLSQAIRMSGMTDRALAAKARAMLRMIP